MNTPVTEEELFELIKKYSFFYENDKNTFITVKNDSFKKNYFHKEKRLNHDCSITLDTITIKIKKITPLHVAEINLFNNMVGIIAKNKISKFSIYEIESLFALAQITSILTSLHIKKTSPLFSFLLSHIKKMEDWASQTYENQGISFCLGIDKNITEESEINVIDIYDEPFCKVLTTGIETMIICNKLGNIIKFQTKFQFLHENNQPKDSINNNITEDNNIIEDNNITDKLLTESPTIRHQKEIITPHVFEWLANWTKEDERIVIHLNSRGEILIFNNGTLAFAKRNSRWHIIKLTPLAHLLPEKSHYNKKMKKALTETCIDVAFRRTGACIGILNNDLDATKHNITNENNKDDKQLIASQDILKNSSSNKTIFFNQLIDNRKFQDLPRELRQELVAVDGATILDKEGNILAVGAILNLDSNPQTEGNERRQGGRSTAAKQLAHYGVGIKVSADGGITAWQKNKNEPDKIKKIFELF